MNIKRNIIFALEARKKNGVAITENVPIRMRVNYSGQRIEFTMPYRIDVAKWDAAKQRVKNGCTNKLKVSASEINAELTRSYTLIQDIFKEFELQELMPTTEQLKDVYTSRTKVEDPKSEELIHQKTFWEIYDEFTEENGKLNDWTKATFEKFAAQRNHLHDFNPNISFDDFTEEGLNDYMDFLGHKLEMRNSTISKQFGFLKWFLRWSMKKGFHQNAAYETFKPKLKKPDKPIIFLTRKEQEQLRDYQIPDSKQYLERVRDVFAFCCFTGLRYSDVYNLRRSDIKDDHIEITSQALKTICMGTCTCIACVNWPLPLCHEPLDEPSEKAQKEPHGSFEVICSSSEHDIYRVSEKTLVEVPSQTMVALAVPYNWFYASPLPEQLVLPGFHVGGIRSFRYVRYHNLRVS